MRSAILFFKEVTREFMQITWLKKQEAMYFTLAVVAVATTLSLFFCGIDYVFFKLIKYLLGIAT